jgi:signal transduction histidine kinase
VKKTSWVIWSIIAWLIFVVSLTIWWLIFSLRIISQLSSFTGALESTHHQKMLMMEGGTLIFFLIVGGVALVYFALREKQRFEEVRHFFSTFSHDLKTSISRLVLQGEILFQNEKSTEASRNFQRNLLALEMQLENSLHLAQAEGRRLTLQKLDLKSILSRVHGIWPELKVSLKGPSIVYADAVALESIIKNLVSNSVLHGQADEIYISITPLEQKTELIYADNGRVFEGDPSGLGERSHPSKKSTGLGLQIVRQWTRLLGHELQFSKTQSGSLQAHILFSVPGGHV